MSFDFTGKNVLITAGAAGIGAAIAGAFARNGANVHVVDIDRSAIGRCRLDTEHGQQHRFTIADVADEAEVERCISDQMDQFGGMNVLVNCAGIKGPTAPVESIALEDWTRCLDVNLVATFLCCKHSVPMLKGSAGSSIINISSTAGWHGYPLRSPYAAAKWAVIGFTKSIAMELGPLGIRANAICPGSVTGDRMDRVIADEAMEKGLTEDQVRKQYTEGVSMRTFIEPDDIAQTALFLGSAAAGKITGQAMSVDGHLESFA